MLQRIREKAQGFLAWSIIALIIIVFSLWGINNYSAGFGNSKIAAKVDGKNITWKEVDYVTEMQRQYILKSNPQLLGQLDIKDLRAQAQQYLVQQTALDLQAQKQGLVITEQQITKRIATDPAFQENGKFSAAKYKQFLAEIAHNEAMFSEKVRSGMLLEQLSAGINAATFVLDSELDNLKQLIFQQREFGYLIVPTSKFNKDININEEAITQYFQQHQHMFIAPEQVKLAYLELTIDSLAKQVTVNDEVLHDYYQKHENLYTIPEAVEVRHILINAAKGSDLEKSGEARAKIDDILAKIKLGAKFIDLAKQYSDDKISAIEGGNLGKIERGQTVAEFETAAFALTKEGEISEVIQSEYGYHIIQLIKKYQAYLKPYDMVKEQLAENYRREIAETQLTDKGEELANLAFEYSDSLQHAAEKMQLAIQETELFAKDTGGDGIANVPAVIKIAFAPEMLKQNKNSDLIKIDDERYVVARVIQHIPARALELAEVKSQIIEALTLEATKKQAALYGAALLAKLNNGNTPYAIAKEAGLEWSIEKNVDRNNSKLKPEILQQVFNLPKPEADKAINFGFQLATGDYVVLALQKVKISEQANNEQIKQQLQQQLIKFLAQTEFQLYGQALINKAKITIQPQ